MRPPAGSDTNECLRVLRPRSSSGNLLAGTGAINSGATSGPSSTVNDYLIPLTNHRSSTNDLATSSSTGGDGPEQCGYWETSFTREGVKAIARGEPVPETANGGGGGGSTGNLSLGDLRSGSMSSRRRSKGYATVPTFEAPTLSQSQSSQPLLGTPPDSPQADGPNGNDSLPLDATTLCRQSYANVRIANPSAGSNATPSRTTPPTKAERSVKQNEISC